MVPPAGFEPAISTLKGWRPWPLDDGGILKKQANRSTWYGQCELRNQV
ncbi:uncharacterized protein METZ01_LOCUS287647 [marine metagenome]|uniref:Uncharacterized protein n=1 Tax=marine metagenome TaxID=408172 RepID=A0A382LF60_9ZZZZ